MGVDALEKSPGEKKPRGKPWKVGKAFEPVGYIEGSVMG